MKQQITEEVLNGKYESLPQRLRESLDSESNIDVIEEISREHNLGRDDEDLLKNYTSYVILGFLPPKDLFKELAVFYSDEDEERVVEVVRDINRKILFPIIEDIKKLYEKNNPESSEDRYQEGFLGKDIKIAEIGSNPENISVSVPIKKTETEGGVPAVGVVSNAPFILHEEKKSETVAGGKTSIFKNISIPLGFFKSRNQPSQTTKPTRVEIETPKPEKRTVNYSELRTSLSPFEGGQSFIHPVRNPPSEGVTAATSGRPISNGINPVKIPETEKITPEIPKDNGPTPDKSRSNPFEFKIPDIKNEEKGIRAIKEDVIPKIEIMGTIKKPEPKVEGNVIDLKN